MKAYFVYVNIEHLDSIWTDKTKAEERVSELKKSPVYVHKIEEYEVNEPDVTGYLRARFAVNSHP